ncbi:nuclear receptor subfamily 2 group E member 1 isoform X1 [Meriones unguiculatus]|uniref:nuclear receptor subfamily 2 group E member 1 isoform X1 n=1 Tax=Meriones unguiculatus TaxID=10047 RepID=UPI00293E88A6|nr:nuclear receptor subfamily 2 group E member 1 isoform X1 [Meriones unguiculatus]
MNFWAPPGLPGRSDPDARPRGSRAGALAARAGARGVPASELWLSASPRGRSAAAAGTAPAARRAGRGRTPRSGHGRGRASRPGCPVRKLASASPRLHHLPATSPPPGPVLPLSFVRPSVRPRPSPASPPRPQRLPFLPEPGRNFEDAHASSAPRLLSARRAGPARGPRGHRSGPGSLPPPPPQAGGRLASRGARPRRRRRRGRGGPGGRRCPPGAAPRGRQHEQAGRINKPHFRHPVQSMWGPQLREALRGLRLRRLLRVLQEEHPEEPNLRLQVWKPGRMPRRQDPQKPVQGVPAEEVFGSQHEQRCRAARAGASDVHHPQTGGPLLPRPQGRQRGGRALPLGGAPGSRLLHGGHAAGAAQPGVGRRVRHTRAPDPREPCSAHAQVSP